MRLLPLLLPVLMTTLTITTSGCSNSASKQAMLESTAIGAVGAYDAGLAPERAATAVGRNNFIYSQHSVNAGHH